MRSAVLFRRAREVRTSGRRRAARPDECATRFHVRPETLILEVTVRNLGFPHQLQNVHSFSGVSSERLLARDALEWTLSLVVRCDDLLDVLDAGMIGTRQPDGL